MCTVGLPSVSTNNRSGARLPGSVLASCTAAKPASQLVATFDTIGIESMVAFSAATPAGPVGPPTSVSCRAGCCAVPVALESFPKLHTPTAEGVPARLSTSAFAASRISVAFPASAMEPERSIRRPMSSPHDSPMLGFAAGRFHAGFPFGGHVPPYTSFSPGAPTVCAETGFSLGRNASSESTTLTMLSAAPTRRIRCARGVIVARPMTAPSSCLRSGAGFALAPRRCSDHSQACGSTPPPLVVSRVGSLVTRSAFVSQSQTEISAMSHDVKGTKCTHSDSTVTECQSGRWSSHATRAAPDTARPVVTWWSGISSAAVPERNHCCSTGRPVGSSHRGSCQPGRRNGRP